MREYESRGRSDLAQKIIDEIKEKRNWDAADSGRMSGRSCTPDFSDLDMKSDRQIVEEYLRQKEQEDYWKNDRR